MSDNITQSATGDRQNGNGNAPAVAGFVLALCAFVFSWIPVLNIILAIMGIIFSGVGMAACQKEKEKKSLAIAGLVMGIVILVGNTMVSILVLVIGSVLASLFPYLFDLVFDYLPHLYLFL